MADLPIDDMEPPVELPNPGASIKSKERRKKQQEEDEVEMIIEERQS